MEKIIKEIELVEIVKNGEIVDGYETHQISKIDYMEKGWRKTNMRNFMNILINLTQNKQLLVIDFIINNVKSDNTLRCTQKEIIEKLQLNKNTVNQTFIKLNKLNFIKKVGCVYQINPYIMGVFGSTEKNNKEIKEGKWEKYKKQEKTILSEKEKRELEDLHFKLSGVYKPYKKLEEEIKKDNEDDNLPF